MRCYLLIPVLALYSLVAVAEQWEHTYALTGKPEIVVDANDGDVEAAMAASGQATVRVITRGLRIDQDLHITADQSGNRITLRLRRDQKPCFGLCFQSIRIELRVPREANLKLHSEDGNLRVEKISGSFELESRDGDIALDDSEGSLAARTRDGNIDVRGRFKLLNLHTGDGNVSAAVMAAVQPEAGWIIRSGDGNVRLRLPGDLGADLLARTGDGEVRVDFPMTTSGSREENVVRGKINGGGIPIELSTQDGDIQVERM
ncbi:MAG: DUF4097 family beta strand repeat protein [Acidobacteria bacterium]|nr:DUF4097 family beta strand repeat protein [Acidobacteriota bacterium]